MMRLYWYEIKKFFHSRLHFVLILLLLLFPILNISLNQMVKSTNQFTNGGQILSELEGEKMADQIRKENSGVINSSWLNAIEKQFEEVKNSDMDKWDIRYSTISDAYWIGVHKLATKEAVLADDKAPALVKEDIKSNEFRFGAQEGWNTKLALFRNTALFYILILTYFFCDMFNQEDAAEVMDLLKSSYHGRKTLVKAKLAVTFTITILLGISLYTILSISSLTLLDMSGSDTTVLLKNTFQIYSYAEIDIQAFALLIIGGLAVSTVSMMFSTLIKKPQVSLCVGAAFYFIPLILLMAFSQVSILSIFPSMFLKIDEIGQLLNTSWITIGNSVYHRVPFISTVWLFLGICLLIIIYWSHTHAKNYLKFRKRGLQ